MKMINTNVSDTKISLIYITFSDSNLLNPFSKEINLYLNAVVLWMKWFIESFTQQIC